MLGSIPQGPKPELFRCCVAARLKPCPYYKALWCRVSGGVFPLTNFRRALVDWAASLIGQHLQGLKPAVFRGRFAARDPEGSPSRALSKLVEAVPFHEAYGSRALSRHSGVE